MSKHRCRFRKENELNFETYLPFASCWQKFRRFYRKFTIVSLQHPHTRKFFKSYNAVNKERRKQVEAHSLLSIHPMSIFRKYWDILIFFCLTYTMIAVPYVVKFFDQMSHGECVALIIIDLIFCTVLFIEIYLKFFTGYTRTDLMEVVLDRKKIVKRYFMTGEFFVDFIGSLPYALIVSFAQHRVQYNDQYNDLEILSQQKWRMISIFYLINVFRCSQLLKYFSVIPNMLNWSEKRATYVKLTFTSILFVHWIACFRLHFPDFFYILNDSELITMLHSSYSDGNKTHDRVTALMGRLDDIQTRDMRDNRTIYDIYVRSFTVTAKLSLACGFGAETDDDEIQMAMTSIILIIGWIYFRYVFVTVMRMIISSEASKTQYEILYNEIEVYSKAKHIPKHLKEKIFFYYSKKYKQHYFNEELIVSFLSKNLKTEILMHTCHSLLDKVYLFNGLPENTTKEIIKCLSLEIFLPHEVIIAADTEGDSMFFLASGTAAVYSNSGKEICHLRDGDHFGEITLLEKDLKRTATIISLESCEIYKLTREDFTKIVQPQSDLYERLKKIANERMGKKSKQRESLRVIKSFIN